MTEPEPEDLVALPSVNYYLFLGFSGLVVLFLALMERIGTFAVVPGLIGVLGLATFLVPRRLGSLRKPVYFAPVVMLLVTALFLAMSSSFSRRSVQVMDVLAAPALLAYLGSQYRLFTLGWSAVPVDVRPRLSGPGGDAPEARPLHLVSPREPVRLIVVIALCSLAGLVLWQWLLTEWRFVDAPGERRLGMNPSPWHVTMLIWLLGVGALVLTGMFRILRSYRMSQDEAALIGVDTLWTETRGEQRRLARWMAWRRRKSERKLEKPT
jgi:hypothetical protein